MLQRELPRVNPSILLVIDHYRIISIYMYKIGRKRKSENTNRKLMTTTGQIVGSSDSADILLTKAASLSLDKTTNSDE